MVYVQLKRISKFIFDHPLLYESKRLFYLGGLPFAQTLQLIDSRDSDVILDVGCGPGYYAEKLKFKSYIGFDSNPRAIEAARRRGIPNATFVVGDVMGYDFKSLKPTKAVLSGILHHLNDTEAVHLLDSLAKIVTQWIVTEDPIFSTYHIFNNLLCRLDRGEFVRSDTELEALIARTELRIEKKLIFYANTKISRHIAFRFIPTR